MFDGDDTLWFVEPLYDRARSSVAAYVEQRGLSRSRWDRLQRAIDVENVARFGLSKERFPTSCVEAFDQVAAEFGLTVTGDERRRVYDLAASVFESHAEVAPGAAGVLARLRDTATLVLLTKGDESVQRARIEQAGLSHSFDSIRIVDDKTESTFFEVLRDANVDPADAWSVGNSVASDINPALWLGMSAIWIDAHVWEHERRESDLVEGRVFTASALTDVVSIIEAGAHVPA